MNVPTDYKRCPACGQPAILSKPFCGRCGRAFQTNFAAPGAAMVAPVQAPLRASKRNYRALFLPTAACFAVILFVLLLFAVSSWQAHRVEERAHAFLGSWQDSQPGSEQTLTFMPDGTGSLEYWIRVPPREIGMQEMQTMIADHQPAPEMVDRHIKESFHWHTTGAELILDTPQYQGLETLDVDGTAIDAYKLCIWSVTDDGKLLTLATALKANIWTRKKP